MTKFNGANLLETPITMIDVEDFAYMASARVNGRTLVSFQMDPATAALLWEIGKGVLAKLGAKALAKLFGSAEETDIEGLLRKLLLDIADVIKSSLDEAEIKQATSQMEGLSTLMREYNRSPDTSRFRLENCITESAQILKRLENLLPLSASAYIFGVLVRLAIAQEYAHLTNSPKEASNVSAFALESLPKLKASLERLTLINEARVSTLTVNATIVDRVEPKNFVAEEKRGPAGETHHYVAVVSVDYYVDGALRRFNGEGSKNEKDSLVRDLTIQATAAQQLDIGNIRTEFMSRVGISMAQSFQSIEKISQMV